MKKFFLAVTLLMLSFCLIAQSALTPGARQLFKNTNSKLSVAEKNKIFSLTGFLLSKDKKQFVDGKDAMDFPFDAFVYPVDLNKDGREEIVILFGNSYTSGHTGSSVLLFIKNTAGAYQSNLGFPGTSPYALTVSSKGFPDLVIGGPGWEFPVWRWNGRAYAYHRKITDKQLGAVQKTDMETLSKQYAGGNNSTQ